jgi:hypothetical protein
MFIYPFTINVAILTSLKLQQHMFPAPSSKQGHLLSTAEVLCSLRAMALRV